MSEPIEEVFNLKKEAPNTDSSLSDFLAFRTMITPVIIQILFWIGLVMCIVVGIIMIAQGANQSYGGDIMIIQGVFFILLGPLLVRLYCEFLILFFRINATLTEIKNKIGQK